MDTMEFDIIGGGLAGLTAAIALSRNKDSKVRVFEKKQYPCIKLCGEFLSPEGLAVLARVTNRDVPALEHELNLRRIRKFSWVTRRSKVLRMELQPGAWAVRRDVLDPWLARVAQSSGAQVQFGVGVDDAGPMLRETGARVLWAIGKEHARKKSRYFAVKGYCASSGNPLDESDIMLYQLSGGYIGFTRMSGGELSYCALLDRERVESVWRYANWAQLCEGIFTTNPMLASWASQAASLLESHVGAARFDFATYAPVREGRWYAGDAVQLVPPFVGDGMAMAIESGELAALALAENWSPELYEARWRKRFLPRVRVARALHPLLWMRHEPVVTALSKAPMVANWLYRKTRGNPSEVS